MKKILAVDIGVGTQDVLLYDASLTLENCISMILPSPTRRYVQLIEQCEHDLFISGDTIGGGEIASALLRHRKKGFKVIMTEAAAYTLRNSLEQVKEDGVIIDDNIGSDSGQPGSMHLCEFDWPYIRHFLSFFGESGDIDSIAVAVQDHGVPPVRISNRAFRFQMIQHRLHQDRKLESFAYAHDDIPPCYKRMKAVAAKAYQQCRVPVIAMDTCFAAIIGGLENVRSAITVNVGNSHTVAAIVHNGTLSGLMEHHTECLTTEKLDELLKRLLKGALTCEEVYNDGGHGAVFFDSGGFDMDQPIIVTGPKRNLLKQSSLQVYFAAPNGNMMLTGSFGLVHIARQLKQKEFVLNST